MKVIYLAFVLIALSINALGQNMPKPKIRLVNASDAVANGNAIRLYEIEIVNRAEISDELFMAAPALPPCGRNNDSSRTWINIYDEKSVRLYGWCAIKSNGELASLKLAVAATDPQPKKIFIDLIDRAEGRILRSNKVNVE